MTARGVDFLEIWIGENLTGQPADAGKLAAKLLAEAAAAGFTLADMELDEATVEDYIRDAMVHLDKPGTPAILLKCRLVLFGRYGALVVDL